MSGLCSIVRGWCSFGGEDDNAPGSVSAFWSGGAAVRKTLPSVNNMPLHVRTHVHAYMQHVDVYMFPCAGADPTSQVNSFVSFLSSNSVQFG
jgi:hypothetical protein